MATPIIPNIAAVRGLVADAKPVPRARAFDGDPDPHLGRNGVEPGKWLPNSLGLPEDCPVVPLGISGNTGYFIDPIGQVQSLEPPYGKGHLLGLFCGRSNYLAWAWPRWGKKGIDGYAAEAAAASLIGACAAKGPWSSVEKIRGRGAWEAEGGGIIYHTGIDLISGGKRRPPGEIDGAVYPTRPPIPSPWPGPIEEGMNPSRLLSPIVRSWNWDRPDVDPVLYLGWIGAAMIGGALPCRPTIYVSGDKATGKSTLQELTKDLFGGGMIQAVDTSAAGLYQHIGNDSLAIAVDELEGEADPRKAVAVLKLARLSASGGLMLRGGDRHNPVEFRARSCFMFSSINTPPLRPQDLSRMALLRLKRQPDGAVRPRWAKQDMEVIGRCVLRRLLEEWPRFPETWAAYRDELAKGGMDGRGQDTYGTLLACADMIEHRGWDEARVRTPVDGDLVPWSKLLSIDVMIEFEDAAENWLKCLSHMLTVETDAWKSGHRNAVGKVLIDLWHHEDDMTLQLARTMLGKVGLGLVQRGAGPRDLWLAVPNQNPQTRQLFEGSDWAGDIGACVWAGALRQSPQGKLHVVAKARVNGVVQPSTLISLAALYGDGGIMTMGDDGLS